LDAACIFPVVQMNHDVKMMTTVHPLTTDTSMAVIADLNTLYRNAIAK
jgi:hypothetical protein